MALTLPVKPQHSGRAEFLIIAAGVVYLVLLLSVSIRHRSSYVSGDSAIKSMLVIQDTPAIARSVLNAEPVPLWIRELWSKGLYPMEPPFAYPSGDGWRIGFPPYFQLASAPMVRTLGYPGQFVLSFFSTLLCWLAIWRLFAREGVTPVVSCIGLATFIFSTHLTPYGALFWEHSPAVLLTIPALFVLCSLQRLSIRSSFLAGLSTGGGIFLRPEAGVIAVISAAVLLASTLRHRERAPSSLWFCAGIGIAITVFVGCNMYLFGEPLGIHGRQEGSPLDAQGRLWAGISQSYELAKGLLYVAPYVVPLFLILVFDLRRKVPGLVPRRELQLAIVGLLSLAVIPFLVPNSGGKQIGPRYYLVLLPMLVTLLTLTLGRVWRGSFAPVILLVGVAVGVITNATLVDRFFVKDLAGRVSPLLHYIDERPGTVIVASKQSIFHDLATRFYENPMFLIRDQRSLEILFDGLLRNGKRSFVLVNRIKPSSSSAQTFVPLRCLLPSPTSRRLPNLLAEAVSEGSCPPEEVGVTSISPERPLLEISNIRTLGDFQILEARIRTYSPSPEKWVHASKTGAMKSVVIRAGISG